MVDQNGNLLPFYTGAAALETEGDIAIIGPRVTVMRGGMGGTYIKTLGREGKARLTLRPDGADPVAVDFEIIKDQTEEL